MGSPPQPPASIITQGPRGGGVARVLRVHLTKKSGHNAKKSGHVITRYSLFFFPRSLSLGTMRRVSSNPREKGCGAALRGGVYQLTYLRLERSFERKEVAQ